MIRAAAGDLVRFLDQAFGIRRAGSRHGRFAIEVTVDPEAGCVRGRSKREHVIDVGRDGVRITGVSDWGAACGLYHVQRLLRLRRAPVLPAGRIRANPTLDPALTYPAFKTSDWQSLDFPAAYHPEYLTRIARAGYTGFHIHIALESFCRSGLVPELSRPDADRRFRTLASVVDRARRSALDVFLSLYTLPLQADHAAFAAHAGLRGSLLINTRDLHVLCSSRALTRAFYAEQVSRLFERVPGLAGVFLITGCEGLLHCYTAPVRRGPGRTDCPHCARRDPERVVADLVNGIAAAVKRTNPSAMVVAWPYGAYTWTRTPDARRHVSLLSRDCALMTNFDTGDADTREGVRFVYNDYNLSCVGPSRPFVVQTRAARRHGLATLAKLESGTPVEMMGMPGIPAMARWARKYAAVLERGVSGAMFNWEFMGYTGSLPAELAAWMSWAPCPPPARLLRQLAARDFGPANVPSLLAAWRHFDRAMEHYPLSASTYGVFKGPFYIGFTHPLILDPLNPGELSPQFWLRHGAWADQPECEAHCVTGGTPMFVADLSWTYPFGAAKCLSSIRKMETHWQRGCQMLARARSRSGDPADTAQNLAAHRALAEGILCTIRTARNMVRFLAVRDEYFREPGSLSATRRRLCRMRAIARDELANAEHGLSCIRTNPMLGFNYIYRHAFTEEMAASKIKHTRRLVEFDIPFRMFCQAFSMHGRDEWIRDDGKRWR